MYARLINCTGWTIEQVGELTLIQAAIINHELSKVLDPDYEERQQEQVDDLEIFRAAGVLDRIDLADYFRKKYGVRNKTEKMPKKKSRAERLESRKLKQKQLA